MIREEEARDHSMQRLDPQRMIVQTWNEVVLDSAGGEENFAAAHSNFFESLQAVGDERRANHAKTFNAYRRQALQFVFGMRREPWVLAQP